MIQGWLIFIVSLAYIGGLFALAYYGDKRATQNRSLSNAYIYALSLAVYCTDWTFYGSVGRAASVGAGFLPIYLGPTLIAALWWFVLRKIIRISKANRIVSIADFIASRYGKSTALGGLVTVIAVIGIIPYISLQLKGVSTSVTLLWSSFTPPQTLTGPTAILGDTGFYVALLLTAFAILFGTRHLDATEHHHGMVVAIAFESVIKLLAFLAVGVFVTFGLYQGFGDLFTTAAASPELARLFTLEGNSGSYVDWAGLMFLSMMAIMFLPRQFQVTVVENINENHLHKAIWLFPLYLLAINLFVLPIALAGLMKFPGGGVDADTFVLSLPLAYNQPGLTMFAFIGGLSAATGMVIVETVALSIMVSNDLVIPVLLRIPALRLAERKDLSGLLLAIRRSAIGVIVLLGYLYFRLTGEAYALVSIGLVSFAAVAQFAPAILGGLYWREGNRTGTLIGLSAGFMVWAHTLLLPSLVQSSWLPLSIVEQGPFGLAWLKPHQLFGLTGLDPITHALFWSLLVNVVGYVAGSLLARQSVLEHSQAALFVDIFKRSASNGGNVPLWRGIAYVSDLRSLLSRFLGPNRADDALAEYARQHHLDWAKVTNADAELVHYAETLLAGSIGAASARVMVASIAKEEPLRLGEVMGMLDETIAYSRQLEQKSQELEAATTELRAANDRLKELDRLKDDFISTVSHELRTPLTSIRAFSEILYDNPSLELGRRAQFLHIILKESERLTRLINQVLDLSKIESGNMEWQLSEVDMLEVITDSLQTTSQLFSENNIHLQVDLPPSAPLIVADHDRIQQVMLNLLSNAIKFCSRSQGQIKVRLQVKPELLQVDVSDNGPGISPQDQQVIFDKFRQGGDTMTEKPQGTGLGLPISRRITHFGGRLWVESAPGRGAVFSFTLPVQPDNDYGWAASEYSAIMADIKD